MTSLFAFTHTQTERTPCANPLKTKHLHALSRNALMSALYTLNNRDREVFILSNIIYIYILDLREIVSISEKLFFLLTRELTQAKIEKQLNSFRINKLA